MIQSFQLNSTKSEVNLCQEHLRTQNLQRTTNFSLFRKQTHIKKQNIC